MKSAPKWVVVKVNGKIASVSLDYSGAIALLSEAKKDELEELAVFHVSTEELFKLSESLSWEDLSLKGSKFQLEIWKGLFDLTHGEGKQPQLMSYTEFAAQLGRRSGVRAVAHAIGKNPVCVIVPCHLIIPKESMDRLLELESENNLFKWKALYTVDSKINYGEYSLGSSLKRKLIGFHLAR